jgi:hypothetical protein
VISIFLSELSLTVYLFVVGMDLPTWFVAFTCFL